MCRVWKGVEWNVIRIVEIKCWGGLRIEWWFYINIWFCWFKNYFFYEFVLVWVEEIVFKKFYRCAILFNDY